MNPVDFLQAWYQAQCDGRWEQSRGITIESLNNPGWLVSIDLIGTQLQNRDMPIVAMEVSRRDWLICEVSGGHFFGQGDAAKLLPILQIFQTWAESAAA